MIALNPLGQVSMSVNDVDAAERSYALFVEKASAQPFRPASPVLYFRVADIALTVRELKARSVAFVDEPHLIAPMEGHDLWMAFFKDPAGNTLALMQEAPKGYEPAAAPA